MPTGAINAGFTKCVVDEVPKIEDISPDGAGNYKWYSGQWYFKKAPALGRYSNVSDGLQIRLGGDLTSARRDMTPGALPLLPGSDGFYVEFETSLSSNDRDHWPALWIMPIEHNNRQEDSYPGDPEKFERWMELDVDEGGFGPGITGTVLSWSGQWTGPGSYTRLMNKNNVSKEPLNRTKRHTFGASFDPRKLEVIWWLDGKRMHSAVAPHVPNVARLQSFYLIMGATSHKQFLDFSMVVHRVRVYSRPESPLEAKGC
jgi:hypothetical protein